MTFLYLLQYFLNRFDDLHSDLFIAQTNGTYASNENFQLMYIVIACLM